MRISLFLNFIYHEFIVSLNIGRDKEKRMMNLFRDEKYSDFECSPKNNTVLFRSFLFSVKQT